MRGIIRPEGRELWSWALWFIYMGVWWEWGVYLRVYSGLRDVLMRNANSNFDRRRFTDFRYSSALRCDVCVDD